MESRLIEREARMVVWISCGLCELLGMIQKKNQKKNLETMLKKRLSQRGSSGLCNIDIFDKVEFIFCWLLRSLPRDQSAAGMVAPLRESETGDDCCYYSFVFATQLPVKHKQQQRSLYTKQRTQSPLVPATSWTPVSISVVYSYFTVT